LQLSHSGHCAARRSLISSAYYLKILLIESMTWPIIWGGCSWSLCARRRSCCHPSSCSSTMLSWAGKSLSLASFLE
jgi:hypothetical protein